MRRCRRRTYYPFSIFLFVFSLGIFPLFSCHPFLLGHRLLIMVEGQSNLFPFGKIGTEDLIISSNHGHFNLQKIKHEGKGRQMFSVSENVGELRDGLRGRGGRERERVFQVMKLFSTKRETLGKEREVKEEKGRCGLRISLKQKAREKGSTMEGTRSTVKGIRFVTRDFPF